MCDSDLNTLLRNGKLDLKEPLFLRDDVRDIEEVKSYARSAARYLIDKYAEEEIKEIHNFDPTAVDLGDFTIDIKRRGFLYPEHIQEVERRIQKALSAEEEEDTSFVKSIKNLGFTVQFEDIENLEDFQEVFEEVVEEKVGMASVFIDDDIRNVVIFVSESDLDRKLILALAFVLACFVYEAKPEEYIKSTSFDMLALKRHVRPMQKIMLMVANEILHPDILPYLKDAIAKSS